MIYHYTTIEALDAILTSNSILFNKLTNVDDVEEFESFIGPFNPREYIFVSSWTKSDEENLLLWNCYTDNKVGVRIGIPDMPFPLFSIDSKWISTDGGPLENYQQLLPFNQAVTKDYFIISFFYIQTDFEKQVIYLSKEALTKKYIDYARMAYQPGTNTTTLYSKELGKYKIKTFEGHKEFRFVLNILPQTENFYLLDHPEFMRIYNQGVLHHINQKTKNQLEYFLLPFRKEVPFEMQIMLSPYGDADDLDKVKAIMNKHHLAQDQLTTSSIRIQYRKGKG